jgi:hypothetical protein
MRINLIANRRFIPIVFLLLISCGENSETKRLREENERIKSEMERKNRESDSIAVENTRQLKESQAQLELQIQEQQEQRDLEKLADDEPQSMSNLKIRNETQQGTILQSNAENLFEADKVRYIGWNADFTDNAVKAGKKTYGKIYARYLRKNSYSDSWTVFEQQNTFEKRDGTIYGYTRKYNMIHDGREHYNFGSKLGSPAGDDFDVGKWKIELFWEIEETGKSYYLGGQYFEIY